jgi:branched-chain amino acid transport system permease protein
MNRSKAGTQSRRFEVRSGTVAAAVFLMALLLLPLVAHAPILINATDTLILILLVLSLNLLVGYGGMISMGHAAFYATGGYAAGLLAKYFSLPIALTLPGGAAAAAVLASVIGFFSIRLTHAYFIMLTLAFAQLVHTVIWKWSSVTGGDDGLIGFGPPAFLAGTAVYYYFTLIVVAICICVLWRICQSPFGRTLKAIHDNPERTAFVGVNVRAVQLAAFVLAGAFAGIAGGLQAYFNRGMFVNSADFLTSADALVILLLGGSRWFVGPIIGAVVFKLLYVTIPTVTVYWQFFLGIIILIVAFSMPNGLYSLTARFSHEKRYG